MNSDKYDFNKIFSRISSIIRQETFTEKKQEYIEDCWDYFGCSFSNRYRFDGIVFLFFRISFLRKFNTTIYLYFFTHYYYLLGKIYYKMAPCLYSKGAIWD